MMTAAETYAALVDAANAQRLRLHGAEAPGARWDRETARRFRFDPYRRLDAHLEVIAPYVEPQDVLIDVGGGARRICLPMALRCQGGIVVDVAQAMQEALQACAAAAGITNVRIVRAAWLAAGEMHGGIAVAASVTYFIRDIVAFIWKEEVKAQNHVIKGEREIYSEFAAALDGIEGYSHLFLLCYFHHLRPEQIGPLQVKPRRLLRQGFTLEELPSLGVFALESPTRPNPIGLTLVRFLKREACRLFVEGLDYFDGTPILDIKGYGSSYRTDDYTVPTWHERLNRAAKLM